MDEGFAEAMLASFGSAHFLPRRALRIATCRLSAAVGRTAAPVLLALVVLGWIVSHYREFGCGFVRDSQAGNRWTVHRVTVQNCSGLVIVGQVFESTPVGVPDTAPSARPVAPKWHFGCFANRPSAFAVEAMKSHPLWIQRERDAYRTTLAIHFPYWLPATLLAVVVAIQAVTRVRHRATGRARGRAGRCLACGYDLRASVGRCPECGSTVAVAPGRESPPPTTDNATS